jgi:ferredoxin--NADP+ reductase
MTNATLVAREDLTESIAIFTVRPDDGPRRFVAGQYFSLGLEVDGRVVQRPYSVASLPGSMELEFLVRHVSGGALTPALWSLAVGSRLFLGPPKGLFTLHPRDTRDHLFVATGTGLAPLVAMLDSVGAWSPRAAVVVHGAARAAELAFRSRLERGERRGHLAYAPTVSRPAEPCNAGWQGRIGRITAVLPDVFVETGLDPRHVIAYLCGGPTMIDDVSSLLASLGVPHDAIVSERYWAAA